VKAKYQIVQVETISNFNDV